MFLEVAFKGTCVRDVEIRSRPFWFYSQWSRSSTDIYGFNGGCDHPYSPKNKNQGM